jgi:2-keto-4-pentenoate hydratase
VGDVDPRLVAALARQLRTRQGKRVGWKLGVGDRERIGGHIAVGHLTARTRLESNAVYVPESGEDLHADAEVAVQIGGDGEIAAYGAALELVDLRSPPETPEEVVAANVFHRAVAFASAWNADLPGAGIQARLLVNGEERASGPAATDFVQRIRAAADILAAVGEKLERSDVVIAGSVVQVPVAPGDAVEAELGQLGRVSLQIRSR